MVVTSWHWNSSWFFHLRNQAIRFLREEPELLIPHLLGAQTGLGCGGTAQSAEPMNRDSISPRSAHGPAVGPALVSAPLQPG